MGRVHCQLLVLLLWMMTTTMTTTMMNDVSTAADVILSRFQLRQLEYRGRDARKHPHGVFTLEAIGFEQQIGFSGVSLHRGHLNRATQTSSTQYFSECCEIQLLFVEVYVVQYVSNIIM